MDDTCFIAEDSWICDYYLHNWLKDPSMKQPLRFSAKTSLVRHDVGEDVDEAAVLQCSSTGKPIARWDCAPPKPRCQKEEGSESFTSVSIRFDTSLQHHDCKNPDLLEERE